MWHTSMKYFVRTVTLAIFCCPALLHPSDKKEAPPAQENKDKSDKKPKPVAPKKQKIRAYKTIRTGEDWTVRILDEKGNTISGATFRDSTDYKIKKLYVQLNEKAVGKDEKYAQYNTNTVTADTPDCSRDSKITRELGTLVAGSFKPGMELELDATTAKLVEPKPKGKKK